MGAPMLAALQRAGFAVRGLDIRPPGAFGPLRDVMTTDRRAFNAGLETALTVVRDIEQTEDVLFGPDGLATAPTLKSLLICSTLSPRYVRDLPARLPADLTLIDAPMSGAQIAAKEARLSFMLGGDAQAVEAHQPLFDAMGTHIHRMGPFGSGMQAKVLNNLLAAANTATTRLVLDWAETTDLNETELLNLIHTSSGQNWFASNYNSIEFARDGLAPDNTISILVKDVESALDAAPPGADLSLPKTIQNTIRALKPRP